MSNKVVDGTNCGNCKFSQASVARDVKPSDNLDKHNGIIPDKKDMLKAKEGDLVTLPGKMLKVEIVHCNHKRMGFDVSTHNCCAYWDNSGCLRAFGKQVVGEEHSYKNAQGKVEGIASDAYDEAAKNKEE